MLQDFKLWKRAQDSIAQGALTNSKHPHRHVFGIYPTHVRRGSGCYLFDSNNDRYVDYICGLGTNLLGYDNPKIIDRLKAVISDGLSHSLPTHHEVEAAEALKQFFVFTDQWKFLKTGSEACSAAIKIARAYQGVKNGNENLPEMLARQAYNRFSHEIGKLEQAERAMQTMHQNISGSTESGGNKTTGAKEIREDRSWQKYGEKIFFNPLEKSENGREGSSLFTSEVGEKAWSNRTQAVRDLWRQELTRASPRLLKTSRREMALSIASRPGTPKWLILSDHYHGHHDSFTSLTQPSSGVPIDFGMLPLTGNEDLIEIAAAVIIEPVVTDWSEQRREELQTLRNICTKYDTLLIFDEIITGFRFDKRSVAQFFNINPDLICIGKAIANGLPLAAVGGKAEVMSGDYFISSTYAGEILSLVACKEVTRLLEVDHSYKMTTLWESGANFINRFNEVAGEFVTLEGYPTRGVFKGTPLNKALLFQEAARANILLCASWFYNFQLKDNDFYFFSFLTDFIERMKRGGIALKGEMPISPFAEKMRDGKT